MVGDKGGKSSNVILFQHSCHTIEIPGNAMYVIQG